MRDLLLDRPSFDFDIVVEGDAINLAQSLSKKFGGKIKTHSRFGTAKWDIEPIKEELTNSMLLTLKEDAQELPGSLDLITARTEFYTHPTALPTVERGSIKLDLHRRDFSINTLALRLDGRHYGELYDYWGGLNDLQQKRVRVLHSLSFIDDPTRMLRAVRFEQRFDFNIEDRTLELMNEALPILKQVSGQRLRHEFDLIFSEKMPEKMMKRLDDLNLLTAIHRDLHWHESLNAKLHQILFSPIPENWPLESISDGLPVRLSMAYLIWFLGQKSAKLQQMISRFRFPNQNGKTFLTASQILAKLSDSFPLPPSQITELCDHIPLPAVYAMRQFLSEERQGQLDTYVTTWRHIKPGIDGNDLRKKGIAPGPIYKNMLTQLKAAWIDGHIKSEIDEQAYLEKLLRQAL